jgi:hypothetical protein
MSDNPTAPETPTEPVQPTTETEEVDYKAKFEEYKKIAREQEKRAKENAAKAKRFDELEEANKTEAERLQARIAELEGELTKHQRETLVAKLQAKYGLEDDDVEDFLTGTDEETLNRQADKLAKRLGKATEEATKPRAPRPDGTQGSSQKNPPALNDFDALTKTLLGKVGGQK